MALIVQKYGGSSLASPRHIRSAAARIAKVKESGKQLVVVVSAMGRMTDMLERLAHRTVQSPSQREMDMLLSVGERVSMSLLAMALHEMGIAAISFTGSQSGIVTTNEHTNARIIGIRAHRIREELAKEKVVIIAGFQGVSEQNEITTLGRGGSDTTAVALAAELGAECCEILTDVDGIFTADPRFVADAKLIEQCSYDEALELASRGAKLQARSVEVAKRFSVPIRVAPSRDPLKMGTTIGNGTRNLEHSLIRGVATRDGLTFFKAYGGLGEISEVLDRERAVCRHFQVSEGSCSWLNDAAVGMRIRESLMQSGLEFEEREKTCLVSVVGESISEAQDVMKGFLETVHGNGAEVFAMASNSLSICVAVEASAKAGLASQLHQRFIEA